MAKIIKNSYPIESISPTASAVPVTKHRIMGFPKKIMTADITHIYLCLGTICLALTGYLLSSLRVLVAADADEAFDDCLKLHFRADSGLAFFEELLIDLKEGDALHGWDVCQRSRSKRRRPDLGTLRIKLYEVAMDVFKAFKLSLTLALRFQ